MQDTYTINGTEYWIDEFDAGWLWMSDDEESGIYYATHNEALQGAMDYVSQKEADEKYAEQEALDDKLYGTYDEQVTKTYNSMIRS